MKEMRIKDVMTRDPIVVEVPGLRRDVLKIFMKSGISGIPVVKKGTKKIVGIVTRRDLYNRPNEGQLAMIMTRNPTTLSKNAKLKTAVKLMVDNSLYRIPVVDKDELVGIITTTDVLRVIADMEMKEPLEKYMRPICIPVYLETPISVVYETFLRSNAYALPIVDDNCRLVGIVTDRDIFDHSKMNVKEVISNLGISDYDDTWTWEGIRNVFRLYYKIHNIQLPKIPVKDVMVRKITFAYRKTPIPKAASKMVLNNFRELPIVDMNERIAGLIDALDLIKVLL